MQHIEFDGRFVSDGPRPSNPRMACASDDRGITPSAVTENAHFRAGRVLDARAENVIGLCERDAFLSDLPICAREADSILAVGLSPED